LRVFPFRTDFFPGRSNGFCSAFVQPCVFFWVVKTPQQLFFGILPRSRRSVFPPLSSYLPQVYFSFCHLPPLFKAEDEGRFFGTNSYFGRSTDLPALFRFLPGSQVIATTSPLVRWADLSIFSSRPCLRLSARRLFQLTHSYMLASRPPASSTRRPPDTVWEGLESNFGLFSFFFPL